MVPPSMGRRLLIAAAILAGVAAVTALAVVVTSGDDDEPEEASIPGEPAIEVISPRDGSRHEDGAVVVKVKVRNFHLAPRHFGEAPELGEGFIRFSLRKVPEDLAENTEEEAASNPTGAGRAVGPSFDYPRNSGPNGILAARIGTDGSYSPATVPEIYYRNLPHGFYRLIITLAQNNGIPTPFHGVTHFRIE
jgi:hypothetical protein